MSDRPTQDEVDRIAALIAGTSYASEAVEVFEDWTRERWGMESTLTSEVRAAMAVPCDLCGHPKGDHNSMSQRVGDGDWERWEWCSLCDAHPPRNTSIAAVAKWEASR